MLLAVLTTSVGGGKSYVQDLTRTNHGNVQLQAGDVNETATWSSVEARLVCLLNLKLLLDVDYVHLWLSTWRSYFGVLQYSCMR